MNFGWQDIGAVGLVLAAALYFGWRLWRLRAIDKPPSCAGCQGCNSEPPDKRPLVTLDSPAKK